MELEYTYDIQQSESNPTNKHVNAYLQENVHENHCKVLNFILTAILVHNTYLLTTDAKLKR